MASLLSPLRSPVGRLMPRTTSVHLAATRYAYSIKSTPRQQNQYPFPRFPRKPTTRQKYSTVVVQDRPRGRTRRIFVTTLLGAVSFAAGAYLALSYAPPFLLSFVMGSMPTDEDTLKYEAPDEWSREIDEHIKNCRLAMDIRADPEWKESRPSLKFPAEVAQHNLTAGTLSGPDMIPVPPFYFNKKDGSEMFCIFYVGTHVSGHPGVVHGGFLATMLDEGLARCAFPLLPNKVGVTAQLNIGYKKPTMAGQFLVLHAKTTKAEGRKVWSEGGIFPLEEWNNADGETPPQALVTAEALFIEPKHAKFLKSLYRNAT